MDDNRLMAPCPRCGKRLRFGPEALGRKGRCLSCNQKLAVLGNGRVYGIESPTISAGQHHRFCAEAVADGHVEPSRNGRRLTRTDQLVLLAMLALALFMIRNWLRDGRSDVPGSEVTAPAMAATSVSRATRMPANMTVTGLSPDSLPPMVTSWEPDFPAVGDASGLPSVDDAGNGITLSHPVKASDWLRRGLTHCRDGRYTEGLHCLEQVVFYDPDDAQAHYYRGRALCCLDRHAEAVTAYERSLAIDPQRSVVRPHLAEALAVLRQSPQPSF